MPKLERRALILGGVLLLMLGPQAALATPRSRKRDTADRVLQRRYYQRRQQDLTLQQERQIEQQRSRPVPPTSPGSLVVPNR